MKYMLAVDGYTMSNGDGFNSQAYFLENNTLGVLKDKKDGVKVCNLENYVGGGESVDYDLLGIKDNVSVLYIREEKKGLKINVLASLEKNADIESAREILNNEFKKLRNEYEVEVLISADLAIFDSLEALEKSIAENDFARRVFDGEDSIRELEEYFKDLRSDEADKMKFSTIEEGLKAIHEACDKAEISEGEFADYLVLNYDECFDSSIEPVVAIQAIQEFRQWDYEMEGEDAIKTFGGTEALSDNGYYGFIFMRNGQSIQLPDGVRVGIQTEDGGIALDEGIVACFKETKCFNANDYTTHQLIEMEFDNLPDSEHKDNMIDEALQLVEECGYTVGEAANEVLAKNTSFVGLPELFSIRETFLTYVGEWANCKECRTGENRANGSVTYLMDGLYLYEFKTREDAFKYLYDDNRSVPYAMAEYDEELTEANGECSFGEWEFHNGFQTEWLKQKIIPRFCIVQNTDEEGSSTLEDYDTLEKAMEAYNYISANGCHKSEENDGEIVQLESGTEISMDIEWWDLEKNFLVKNEGIDVPVITIGSVNKTRQLLSLIAGMSVNGVNIIDIPREKNFEEIVDSDDATFQIFTQNGTITVDWGEGENAIDVYADSSVNEELVKAFRYQEFPRLTIEEVFDYFQSKN